MALQHPRSVRDHNRSLILRLIDTNPGISRSEIKAQVGLTEAAVSRITRELIDARLLSENDDIVASSRPGRRHIGLSLAPGGACVLAACLTLYERSLSLVDLHGGVLASVDVSDAMELRGRPVAEALANKAREIVAAAEISWRRVLGLAVVAAGAIDHQRGEMTVCSLQNLTGVPLQPLLEDELGCPVRLENVGNSLNIAEIRTNAAAVREGVSLLIHAALGIGTGLVINGRPHRSASDERMIGHIKVPGASAVCACGSSGCLNTLVSGRALLNQLTDRSGQSAKAQRPLSSNESTDLEELIARANANDRTYQPALRKAGLTLGNTLFSVCAAMRPDRVILAGPLPQATAFAGGVAEGMTEGFERAGYGPPSLQVSGIGYARATELFALEEFLFNIPSAVRRVLAHT